MRAEDGGDERRAAAAAAAAFREKRRRRPWAVAADQAAAADLNYWSARKIRSYDRSLRVVVGAVASSLGAIAVARRSRRRCLWRRAGAPGAGLFVPPRSRRRGALSPLSRGGSSLSRRGAQCSAAHTFCVCTSARSLPFWGRSPSRGACGAAICGASLALLAPARSCRRARGDMALSRRSSAVTARFLSAVRSAQRLAVSACGRRRSRSLSGGDRRRTALTAPLPATPRWRS